MQTDEEHDNGESNPAKIAPARIREDRECDRNSGQTIRELEQDLTNDEDWEWHPIGPWGESCLSEP